LASSALGGEGKYPCVIPLPFPFPLSLLSLSLSLSSCDLARSWRACACPGDNDPDYVIRSGLKAPPQAVAIELSTGSSVVGRDEDCDLIIPIPTVSGSHAKVELEGETLFVTDLESTNGTFVNNERIEPGSKTQLSPGSNVIFGDSNLAAYVVQQDSAASAE